MSNTSTLSKTNKKIDTLLIEDEVSYVAAVFNNVHDAKSAYKKLQRTQNDGQGRIIDAAYVEKTDRSNLRVHDHRDWKYSEGIVEGGVTGAVAGGLIGLIASAVLLPAVIGALVGGAIMSVYEHKDKFVYQDLKEIADTLPIGSSALIAIVEDEYLEVTETEFHNLGGEKVHSNKIPKGTAAALSSTA